MPADSKPDLGDKTAVHDVRKVRERLDREAGGDVHTLAQQSRNVSEELLKKLGLRRVPPTPPKE
jgi:hypothetical protein